METIIKDEDIVCLDIIKDEQSSNTAKQRAFTKIYDKYQVALKNYILKIARGSDEFTREEIFSVTWSKAFSKINSYNSYYPFITWIRKIALNTFIDSGRKKDRESIYHIDVSKVIICDNSYNPHVNLIKKEYEAKFEQFINGLSYKHKEVVKLRLYHNFSCKQISEKLQLPSGTVTTILYRSRILIKKSGLDKL